MNAGRVVVAWMGFALGGAPAVSQQNEPPRVTVTCIGIDGKPVSGAEVHMFQARKTPDGRSDYVASGPHLSDAEGRAITGVALDFDGGRFDRWFHARVPGKLVGAQRAFSFDASVPAAAPTIRMAPARDVSGRVQVPAGFAATSVHMRMLSLHILGGESPFGTPFPRNPELNGLTRTLPDLLDAPVAADGTFTLRDLPQDMRLYLAAEGPGLGQTQWSNVKLPDLCMPAVIDIVMAREGAVESRIVGPDGNTVAGAEVRVRLEHGPVRQVFEARSDANGAFRIAGMPAGEAHLEVLSTAGVMRPVMLFSVPGAVVRPGSVQLEMGVEVRGIARDATTRRGLEGVGISAITDDERHWRLGFALTDPQGRFVLRLPQGATGFYVSRVPAGYRQPSASYADLTYHDVTAGEQALGELLFEIEPAK